MTDMPLLGRPIWYELLTTDMKAAEDFYTKVVGWTVSPFDGAPQPYDMWMRAADVPVGGVMTIPEGMNFPPHWEMYIAAPKLEDAVAHIERLGGLHVRGQQLVPDRASKKRHISHWTSGSLMRSKRDTIPAATRRDQRGLRANSSPVI